MPRPKIGPGEALLRVSACGICGSDVMEWYRRDRVPLVLGHEIAAVVEELGPGVEGIEVGDRVCASHHVPCNGCHYCRNGYHTVCDTLRRTNFYPGGFAEYVRLPALNVRQGTYPLPDCVCDEAATFIEPLGCVLRAQRVADIRPGDTVLVIGSGVSGILHIQAARLRGAAFIAAVDISPWRLDKAKQLGADLAVEAKRYSPQVLAEVNSGRLADKVILCAGAPAAIQQAFASVERAGTVLFFAPAPEAAQISLPVNELFWRRETKLVSSYAASPQDHIDALALIKSGRPDIEKMITHRLPLTDIALGFKLVAYAGESLKVVIRMRDSG